MKFENNKPDKGTLERLEKHGIILGKNTGKLCKEQALVLIGEAMLNKIAEQIDGFISLWKNELFPDYHLGNFEASEKEKQHILGEQDADEDRNSTPTEEDEAGIEYWDLITLKPKRKPVKAGYQLISDLWKNGRVVYLPDKKLTSNNIQQTGQQLLSEYVRHYQFPKEAGFYLRDKIRQPSMNKRFGKYGKKVRSPGQRLKMSDVYGKQQGSKPQSFKPVFYKSLESYLNNYRELVKNEI